MIRLIAVARVGGEFWGAQPTLPDAPYTLVRLIGDSALAEAADTFSDDRTFVIWSSRATGPIDAQRAIVVTGRCDPWHLVGGAQSVWTDANDELALIAAIAGIPLRCSGRGRFEQLDHVKINRGALREAVRNHFQQSFEFVSPFTRLTLSPAEAIELCAFWRNLIEGNRDIVAAVGFARWKRRTVAPLLWNGSSPVPFRRTVKQTEAGRVAVWKSRIAPARLSELESRGRLVEVEDGFIRSVGLGAECVPPLSIVVDRLGIYFDPSGPSDLEQLLQHGSFSPELCRRATALRELIVELGIGKYGAGKVPEVHRQSKRKLILVPGQVEDDRSILCGGAEIESNLELLRRVRREAPNALIIYKPHPDVEAGHRVGRIPDRKCFEFADNIVRDEAISALFAQVDEVHVNTSLAGFEALLRGKSVTTYGVPFYAGWGLTRDLGAVPQRRTARRTLDELVAAVLLVYPRYVDPVTGLPCPPEILLSRLAQGQTKQRQGLLVRLRRLQGLLNRHFRAGQ